MAEKKNPRNSESLLFKRLTRLLSGPLTNYRTQTNHRLRRVDLDKYANRFTSASGRNFKKTTYDPYHNLQMNVMAAQQRTERYVDFDQMEYTPEIASALDIYADEMTTHSKIQKLMSIDCNNEEIKSILESLYFNIMNIEYNLFTWCRSMCKYGDFFLYLDIDDIRGVQSVIGLPAQEVERLEGEDKSNPNYVQYQWNSAGLTFENWQVGHFRILGNDKYNPYGTSILEPSRRIWRQLTLLEDAMMAYRIVRSPDRRAFYIDVGNIPPQDVEQYMQKVMTQMKRNQIVDPDTGRVDLRYNPLSVEEDYFIPVRGQSATKIDSVGGGKYTGDIDDVKYLRDKLFSALKIPPSYLARTTEGGGQEDKSTLAQKDIRFARTIQRLQRSITTELEKIGIIHLYTLGYREEDLVSFKISLNNPSKIAELQELEHWGTKFDIAGKATEGFFSKRWIATSLFGMTQEDFVRNRREMFYDRKYEAALETAAEEEQAEATAATDAAAGGGGGVPGGMPGGGMPEPGGTGTVGPEPELGAPTDAATPPGGGDTPAPGGAPTPGGGDAPKPAEDGDLLAAPPGKREDESFKWVHPDGTTETSRSKGKRYEPEEVDNRQSSGPRKRARNAKFAKEKGGSSKRNVFPGLGSFRTLSKGIYENKGTNYFEGEEIETLNEELTKFFSKKDKEE